VESASFDSPAVGLIDLGSNSVRLMVFRINPNKSYTILTQHKQMVRLGEGSFASKRLSEAAMLRSLDALRNMKEICLGYDVADTVAYATAAVRDAGNSAEFVERAESESGIRLAVISGMEEARLIHLGVSAALPSPPRTGLFIDIGGGSTELIVGRGSDFLLLDSLKLGAVRVTNAYPETSGDSPVPAELYERIKNHVINNSIRIVRSIRELSPEMMIGSSGTIQNLSEIASNMAKAAPQGETSPSLSRRALSEVARKLCSVPLEERKKIPGINPQRADIIIGGAAILHAIMDELGMEELTVTSRGLLDGMLLDYLSRGRFGYADDSMPTRASSVFQLARSCAFNERHAKWVARLAVGLFDSAQAAGLIDYGHAERELLEYAALLHDIGLFLSFSEHHLHSRYMIKNSELLGFNRREIDVIANAAFLHRRWSPKRKGADPYFNEMSGDDRKLARALGIFLRMGEGLDRSQQQTVTSAQLVRTGRRKISLRLVLSRPSPMELYSIGRARGQFKKIFGAEYTVTKTLESQ
jgi:exopolyphosphatase/guanosine-5'-triphosphate,3'-diphosphate pyrophosphatase